MFTDVIGYLAGILLTLCFLPQIVKTFQMKQADDVSMVMLLLSLFSAIFYEIYAWLLGLWPVLVMNGIFGLLVMVEIWLKIHYDRRLKLATNHPEGQS
ncbi:MAG: SemiSWEET family transporter [Thermodesulfobacteriota bacterium]|nr:SemiSWEET family transporter [Thermodesulfobacteriota bacterium]